MPTTLIQPRELAAELDNRQWAVIDCRFDLHQPQWGRQAWAERHIPHALYADLDQDLSGPRAPGSGRHPLPQPQVLAATLGRWGIDAGVQVVAYDQGPGMYAARLWWLLRWLGHANVAVLDGGLGRWERAGLPLSAQPSARTPRAFQAQVSPGMTASAEQVAAALHSGALARGDVLLVDARGADRFAGENETLDAVAGHVPGARNHPFAGNQGPEGTFLDPAQLRQRWQATLAGGNAQRCRRHVRLGCHGLPQPARTGARRAAWRAPVRRILERMDHRS